MWVFGKAGAVNRARFMNVLQGNAAGDRNGDFRIAMWHPRADDEPDPISSVDAGLVKTTVILGRPEIVAAKTSIRSPGLEAIDAEAGIRNAGLSQVGWVVVLGA